MSVQNKKNSNAQTYIYIYIHIYLYPMSLLRRRFRMIEGDT